MSNETCVPESMEIANVGDIVRDETLVEIGDGDVAGMLYATGVAERGERRRRRKRSRGNVIDDAGIEGPSLF